MDDEFSAVPRRSSLIDQLFMYLEKRRPSDSFILKIIILVLFASSVWFAVIWSNENTTSVSTSGGQLTEGIVGTPRFVNPVLAVTRADKDLTELIYSGLMKLGPDGTIIPDIAKTITISDDGLIYNIVLKEGVIFHDGETLTAKDVAFTIGHIQDPALQSPLRSSFEGVTVEELGEYEINIALKEPYAPFIENLTVGILPRHIWKEASDEEFPFSQYNSEPIGSGPYKIKKIKRTSSGIPNSYVLQPNEEYYAKVPRIEVLVLDFYPNEGMLIKDFNEGILDSVAGLPIDAISALHISEETHKIITIPLPRTFALFFNQNKSTVLRESQVRKALNAAIDRDDLIQQVLSGYGTPLYSPIPSGFGIDTDLYTPESASTTPLDMARKILRDAGWSIQEETGIWSKEIDEVETPLAFSITTVNNPLFEATAEYLRKTWEQLGVQISVKQFELSDLTQTVIRPRNYEALLFGTDVGRSLDFYSFWHSSQRNDPGLNVSLYANITTDSLLTEARTNSSSTQQKAVFKRFASEILKETPAIFLYSPQFIYVFPKSITRESFTGLAEPFERFSHISSWFINSESVWPIFQK